MLTLKKEENMPKGEVVCEGCGQYESECKCVCKYLQIKLPLSEKKPSRKWKKGDPLADYDG